MINANLIMDTMLSGRTYSIAELATLSGLNRHQVSKVIIYLEARGLVTNLYKGVLPRKRRYEKKNTTLIQPACSPDILPRGSTPWQVIQKKLLRLVK